MGRALLSVAAATLVLSGCGIQLPDYPLSDYTRQSLLGQTEPDEPLQIPVEIQDAMYQNLDKYYSPPWAWDPTTVSSEAAKRMEHGAELYRQHCIHCHGLAGAGDGPTAEFLYPRPRDYRRGVFKWKSTERNSKPTREDLLSILKNGAVGSSMPPFVLMPEEDLNALVDYVIYLSQRGELERRMLIYYATEAPTADQLQEDPELMKETVQILDEIAQETVSMISSQWQSSESAVVKPDSSRPDYPYGSDQFKDSLARGKQLYLSEKASCYKCHSSDGKAKDIAPSEKAKMVDDWGNPNFPRNLTLGLFRGGRRPIDLYRRIHQGIAGAAMPAGGQNLKADEIWDLVNFVRALPYQPELLRANQAKADPHGGHSH